MPKEETQFKPGVSGNPKGRPKGSRNRSTIVRQILEMENILPDEIHKALVKQFPDLKKNISVEEMMVLVMVRKSVAQGGDVRAFTAIMDSAYGKTLDSTISDGTFEDSSKDDLDNQFYLPPPDEPDDTEDIEHEDIAS